MNTNDLTIKGLCIEACAFFNDIESFRHIQDWFKNSKGELRPIYSHFCRYDDDFYDIHLKAFDLEDVLWWSQDPDAIKARALELYDGKDRHYYVIWEQKRNILWLQKKPVKDCSEMLETRKRMLKYQVLQKFKGESLKRLQFEFDNLDLERKFKTDEDKEVAFERTQPDEDFWK
jgi:hypothetical protein